jgi:hypothetical protein
MGHLRTCCQGKMAGGPCHLDTSRETDTSLRRVGDRITAEERVGQDNDRAPESTAFVSLDLPPDIPNYKIRSILGQGGMGIHRADQALARLVAIKMLTTPGQPTEEQLTRFPRRGGLPGPAPASQHR